MGQIPASSPRSSPGQSSNPPLKFPLGKVPPCVRPYLELIRFEKPTGTLTAFWPFAWGLTLAAVPAEMSAKAYVLDLFKWFLAAFILRSSACTVNDIFDRDFDAGVERCRTRPLPSGRITVFKATVFLFIQYAVGVIFLATTVPGGLALWTAIIQLIPLLAAYPLLKRITYWPQSYLGFVTYFGVIPAWVATTGTVDKRIILALLAAGWCWVMLYDTIYACQDIRDDKKMGVRSTAIRFGRWIRPILTGFGLAFVAMLAVAGILNKNGPLYFAITVGGAFAHLAWQYATVDLDDPKSCGLNFKRNGQLGWVILAGMAIDHLSQGIIASFVDSI